MHSEKSWCTEALRQKTIFDKINLEEINKSQREKYTDIFILDISPNGISEIVQYKAMVFLELCFFTEKVYSVISGDKPFCNAQKI